MSRRASCGGLIVRQSLRRGLLGLVLGCCCAAEAATERLGIGPVPESVAVSQRFPIAVSALNELGQVATNDGSGLRLRGQVRMAEWPVISEVDMWGDVVEVANPGDTALDLSGWELVVGREVSWMGVVAHSRVRLPDGTVLGPKGVFTFSANGVAPGAFPALVSDRSFRRDGNRFDVVLLLDPLGNTQDEFCALYYQNPKWLTLWRGMGLSENTVDGVLVYSRVGAANHFRREDWTRSEAASPGVWNSGLTFPWRDLGDWVSLTPSTVTLTNGVWSGDVEVSVPGQVVLVADNGAGLMGRSATVRVLPLPALTLSVPEALRASAEAAAGQPRVVTLGIPAPVTADVRVKLEWSVAGEFASVSNVVVAAGTTQVVFAVTNLDDPWADGRAQVTLTASAPGFASAVEALWNADDEAGVLWLGLPTAVYEEQGRQAGVGRVWLDAPARHEVLVELAGESPLLLPSQVVVPAGAASAAFSIGVENDALVNPDPRRLEVTARTAGWPVARSAVGVVDDEDRGLAVEFPAEVWEAEPARGVIRLKTARELPLVVRFDARDDEGRVRLGLPMDVTVPAGEVVKEFELRATQNLEAEPSRRVEVWAAWEGYFLAAQSWVRVIDDDSPVEQVRLMGGGAMLSGRPYPFRAELTDAYYEIVRTNAAGKLTLLAGAGLAELGAGQETIQFTNGVWAGDLVVWGSGLGLQLQVAVAGKEAVSSRLDVLEGYEHAMAFADVQWGANAGRFLVLQPWATNRPARLTEVEPLTGEHGRSLDLPGSPRLLAVSDDGQVAWLASASNALVRVNLQTWAVTGAYPLEVGSPRAVARAITVAPGEPDRVVVALNTNSSAGPLFIRSYVAGQPQAASVKSSGNGSAARLSSWGLEPAFTCSWSDGLSGLRLTGQGVVREWTASEFGGGSLDALQDMVVSGDGRVWTAGSGAVLPRFQVAQSLVGCVHPSREVLVFAEMNQTLGFFDPASRERLLSHQIPSEWSGGWMPEATRLLAWGRSGLAWVSQSAGLILAIESPALSAGRPDLAVTVVAPERVELPVVYGGLVGIQATVVVTNRGAGPAHGVEWHWPDGGVEVLGTLLPGQSVRRVVEQAAGGPMLMVTRVSVQAAELDANPLDNVAEAGTVFEFPDVPGSRQLWLGLNHLVSGPGGERLYASLSRETGAVTNGVAVIDPTVSVVERILGLPSGPTRLAVSEDGSRVYAVVGTGVVAGWDLATGSNDLWLQLTNGPVTDLVSVPGEARSVVVVTGGGVRVYDGATARPGGYASSQSDIGVGFAGGLLWVAEAEHLRSFALTATGLEPQGVVPFSPAWGAVRFTSDGRRLYFVQRVFDTLTQETTVAGDLVNVPVPDPALSALYMEVGGAVRRLAVDPPVTRAEQTLVLAARSDSVTDIVRWGADGLAVRSGPQLLVVRTPLVPAGAEADVAVTVSPPPAPEAYVPQEWTVTVTNRSGATAPRTLLVLHWGDWPGREPSGLEIIGPAHYERLGKIYFDLGDVRVGESVVVRVRGGLGFQVYTLAAEVLTGAADPVLADNVDSKWVLVGQPTADVGVVSLEAPLHAVVGGEFETDVVYTNAGPDEVKLLKFGSYYPLGGALELMGWEGCDTNSLGQLVWGPMAAGTSHAIRLRFRVARPGLHAVSAGTYLERNDPNQGNDWLGTVIYAPPGEGEWMQMPETVRYEWDAGGRCIVARCEGAGLVVLDPVTLAPEHRVQLAGYIVASTVCGDGTNVWVLRPEGFSRVNYRTGVEEFNVPVSGTVWSMVSPAWNPDLLVVATDNGMVRVYERGQLLPYGHGVLGPWVQMVCTSNRRVYVGASQQLRELEFVEQGLVTVRNLDSVASWGTVRYREAGERLFGEDGFILDMVTGRPVVADRAFALVDLETGMAYPGPGYAAPGWLEGSDARTLEPVWRMEIPGAVLLTMGTSGFLVTQGGMVRTVPWEARGVEQTDLGLEVQMGSVGDGVGFAMPVGVVVTNRSNWAARGAQLEVVLSGGLEMASGQPGAGGTNVVIPLGTVVNGTNLALQVLPIRSGTGQVQLRVSSLLPEADPVDDVQRQSVEVPDLPCVFLDDARVAEDFGTYNGVVEAWLSRPMPSRIEVPFEILPGTAQSEDFEALTGQFVFEPGQTYARASVIRLDQIPEVEETAALRFAPVAGVFLVRTQALVTVVDNDGPEVRVSNVALKEGASGLTNAVVQFTLSAAAPVPVEIWVRTTPGTAQPAQDYLAREGWFTIAPGETNCAVVVPVVGDTEFEPGETLQVSLVAVRGGIPGTAGATVTIQNDDPPPQPSLGGVFTPGVGLRLEVPTVVGASYQLQMRTNLFRGTWQLVGNPVAGTGQAASFSVGAPTRPESYYRVRAQ